MRTEKKYLLLMEPEEEFPEQINSYIFLVMETLLLAKETDRIFVLPYLHSHPRNNFVAEKGEVNHQKFILGKLIFPMEIVFDQKELSKYVRVVSLEDFLSISRHRLSTLFCFGNKHYNIIDSYGSRFYCQKIIDTKDIDDARNSQDQFIGITGYRRGQFLIKSSPNWPKKQEKEYWEIRKRLQFNKILVKKANNFIAKHKLNKYVAVHWRRGDRVHPEMTTLSEIIVEDKEKMKKLLDVYLINPIKRIMKEKGLNKVFLATNSGMKWHLNYLLKKLPIIQYPPSDSWKTREEESIVEQIICTKANYFLAAPISYQHCSSFSRWIIDSRILDARGEDVSHLQKMGSGKDLPLPKVGVISQVRNQILSVSVPIAKWILRSSKNALRSRPAPSKIKVVNGTVFNQHTIKLDDRSLKVGGSWMPPKRDSKPKTNDPEILKIFYNHIPKNKPTVLYDIGASTGSFSLLAKFNPKMQVYSFEPQPNIFKILERNIKINSLAQRVTTFQIALSDKETVLSLQVPRNLSQSGLATLGAPLRFTQAQSINVASETLDDFAKQFGLPDPTHIKIDTEGAELLVLRGGEGLIRKTKPILLLECSEKNTLQFGYHARQITSLLSRWGYNIKQICDEDILCLPQI